LLTWLQLPALIDLAQAEPIQPAAAQPRAIAEIEAAVASARKAASLAGYDLKQYLASTAKATDSSIAEAISPTAEATSPTAPEAK